MPTVHVWDSFLCSQRGRYSVSRRGGFGRTSRPARYRSRMRRALLRGIVSLLSPGKGWHRRANAHKLYGSPLTGKRYSPQSPGQGLQIRAKRTTASRGLRLSIPTPKPNYYQSPRTSVSSSKHAASSASVALPPIVVVLATSVAPTILLAAPTRAAVHTMTASRAGRFGTGD
jgi:hypothetical protein